MSEEGSGRFGNAMKKSENGGENEEYGGRMRKATAERQGLTKDNSAR